MMDPAVIQQLGFTPAPTQTKHRILLQAGGPKGFGKTTLALTAEGPIFYYKFETGDEGVIEPFAAAGKEIYTYRVYYNRTNWKEVWTQFLDNVSQTCNQMFGKQGTFIFDTMTEVYELGRMAHFGGRLSQVVPREYGVVYVDLKEIVRNVEASGLNGIFIQKMGPAYDNKDLLEVKGWGDLKWDMQVVLSLQRFEGTPEAPGTRFLGYIEECRQKGSLVGTWLENGGDNPLDIGHLTGLVHG